MRINLRTLISALWIAGLLLISCVVSFAGTTGTTDQWRTYLEGLDRMKEGKWAVPWPMRGWGMKSVPGQT
jgi:hypothetical protein